jgi:acetyl-CoA acetyltransferase
MYKRPSKRAETVRLVLLYTFMTTIILVLVTVLVLVVANYRFNKATGTLEQSGLLQLASTPSNAEVSVDGVSIGQRTSTKYSIDPNGGAIALGHPLGMSGTRIVGTAALELQKKNKKYALCTLCIGVGQGYAMIIENVNL